MPEFTVRKAGSGRNYRLDGEPIPSVTTVLSSGFPKPALPSWAATTVAEVAVDEWDHLADMPPTKRYEYLKSAPWRRRDSAAFRGTELHAIGEALALGEPVEVPAHYEGLAQAYADWLDAWGARVELVERSVVNLDHRYAGTFDLVATLKDGRRWLLDLKTGTGVYESHVVQLAAYRYATHWLGDEGELRMWEPIDRAGVIHLRPDAPARLMPVDAGLRAFDVFLASMTVGEFIGEARSAWREHRAWPVGAVLDPERVAS